MTERSIRGEAAAQRLFHSARNPRHIDALSPGDRAPTAVDYNGSGGLRPADGSVLSVDLGEFDNALSNLRQLCTNFTNNVSQAKTLATKLRDGFGPVADVVGNAFNHRLGTTGGMPYVVSANSSLYDQIVTVLQDIANQYQQSEDEALANFSQASGEQG